MIFIAIIATIMLLVIIMTVFFIYLSENNKKHSAEQEQYRQQIIEESKREREEELKLQERLDKLKRGPRLADQPMRVRYRTEFNITEQWEKLIELNNTEQSNTSTEKEITDLDVLVGYF